MGPSVFPCSLATIWLRLLRTELLPWRHVEFFCDLNYLFLYSSLGVCFESLVLIYPACVSAMLPEHPSVWLCTVINSYLCLVCLVFSVWLCMAHTCPSSSLRLTYLSAGPYSVPHLVIVIVPLLFPGLVLFYEALFIAAWWCHQLGCDLLGVTVPLVI